MSDLPELVIDSHESNIVDREQEPIEIGQWYWVNRSDEDPWFACVTKVGTNYARLDSVGHSYDRIHFDEWSTAVRREEDPDAHIESMIQLHKKEDTFPRATSILREQQKEKH